MQNLSCLHLEAKEKEPKKLAVAVHGFGASAVDLFGLARNIANALPDTYFILPNAPNACRANPEGFEWFDLSSTTEESMLRGLKQATIALNVTIDHHLQKLSFKQNQLIFIGFSQGAMLSMHAGLRRKGGCRAIVSFSGALVGGAELLKEEISSRPKICLIHGKQDEVVPFSALKISQEKLQQNNVAAETFALDNLGHCISQQGIEIAIDFLRRSANT
ncbi:phospholipase [Rickettsiales bacterium]|nr:phospholipase [Rickettsiales bacterium]